jgi:hypothetical protein
MAGVPKWAVNPEINIKMCMRLEHNGVQGYTILEIREYQFLARPAKRGRSKGHQK